MVLPPMASFSELVATALRAATHHVSEGSRRNARRALEVRHQLDVDGVAVLAVLAAVPERAARAEVPAGPLPRQHGQQRQQRHAG